MNARFRFLFILICLIPAKIVFADDLPEMSAAQLDEFRARFGGVTAWHVSYRYAGDNPFAWTEAGTHHVRTEWSESSEGEFVLPVTSRGDTSMQVFGVAPSHDVVRFAKVSTTPPYVSETRFDDGQATGSVRVELELDFATGTYRFAVFDNEFPSTYGGSHRDANGIRTFGPSAGRTHVILPVPGSDGRTLRLPTTGTELRGEFSHEDHMIAQTKQINGFDVSEYARDQPTHGRLVWSVTPAAFDRSDKSDGNPPVPMPLVPIQDPISSPPRASDPLDDVELVVTPVDYERWRPKAGAGETDAGNMLSIQARLVSRNGRPLAHRAIMITFSLVDVSHFPGVDGERVSTPPARTADLGFETKQNSDAEISQEGQLARFRHGPYVGVTAVLSSFDTRARGNVIVSARLDDGRLLIGQTINPPGDELSVPKR